jgi:hypothetical protein
MAKTLIVNNMISYIISTVSNWRWVTKIIKIIIAEQLVFSEKNLTPEYLKSLGWEEVEGYYSNPNVKGMDRIWIKFKSAHAYTVTHGWDKTYVSIERTQAWFDYYRLLIEGAERFKITDKYD